MNNTYFCFISNEDFISLRNPQKYKFDRMKIVLKEKRIIRRNKNV